MYKTESLNLAFPGLIFFGYYSNVLQTEMQTLDYDLMKAVF